MHVSQRAVVIEVEPDDERMLKVAVSDSGHGLAEGALHRIFQAFYGSRGATFCFTVPLAAR
jgi:signal transduction histidine kinase